MKLRFYFIDFITDRNNHRYYIIYLALKVDSVIV